MERRYLEPNYKHFCYFWSIRNKYRLALPDAQFYKKSNTVKFWNEARVSINEYSNFYVWKRSAST